MDKYHYPNSGVFCAIWINIITLTLMWFVLCIINIITITLTCFVSGINYIIALTLVCFVSGINIKTLEGNQTSDWVGDGGIYKMEVSRYIKMYTYGLVMSINVY